MADGDRNGVDPGADDVAADAAPAEAVEAEVVTGAIDVGPGGGAEVPEGSAPDPLEEARAQAAGYLDDLKRLKAEFENYRKRMVKEQTSIAERAAVGLIERLLPVLDDFELALLAADRTKDYEAMVRGVEMVLCKMIDELRREGLERIEALHRPFDPERHEAVMRADGEGEELIVVDEMRPGYTLRGRVLRPTMVKVGPRPAT